MQISGLILLYSQAILSFWALKAGDDFQEFQNGFMRFQKVSHQAESELTPE